MNAPAFTSPQADHLFRRITDRSARIGVIGLGYAGLPVATALGDAGFTVFGIDTDSDKCEAINRGESGNPDIPDNTVARLVASGRLHAADRLSMDDHLDAVIVCVPTPLRKTKDPDLSHVVAAMRMLRAHLQTGMLVVLESTTYPGTTEDVVRSILEGSGLEAGTDFFLAFSPERVDPGNVEWTVRNVPKVIGGLTTDCTSLAVALYTTCVDDVVPVSSPRTAEMAKLLENTFRAINIGLVNELALLCDRLGVNIWEVIDAAATKPFGFMPFYPGPGLGGHCVPVDPYYLSWKVRQVGFEARFIDLASQVNAAMPSHVVSLVSDALAEHGKVIRGAAILLLGVAYKAGVSDVRESPALDVLTLLLQKGAHVTYYDAFVPRIGGTNWPGGIEIESVPFSLETIASVDCVVVLTDHKHIDYDELAAVAKLFIDTRNVTTANSPHIVKLGVPKK